MNATILGLDKLKGDWEKIDYIIPYGAGLEAYRTLKRIAQDFTIPFIVDADPKKVGKKIFDIEIRPVVSLALLSNNSKVVVTVAKRRYSEIKEILEGYGLRDGWDFCHISQFGMEWYYKYRNECCIFTMDMALTTYCTLKCKHCNMFIPYYQKPVMYSFADIKENIDLLFNNVDYVFAIGLLGGEALLCQDIIPIIEYLNSEYGKRIGSILITTNGLTIPDSNLLECISRNNVLVTISDYRASIQEKSRLEELGKLLEKSGIVYTIRESLVWSDFGFPDYIRSVEEKDVRKHMLLCDPGWRGLNDKKFFFCNVAWSAEKSGLFQLEENDYIELDKLEPHSDASKRIILKYTTGTFAKDYLSFCCVCGGCGEDNTVIVEAGEQQDAKH